MLHEGSGGCQQDARSALGCHWTVAVFKAVPKKAAELSFRYEEVVNIGNAACMADDKDELN